MSARQHASGAGRIVRVLLRVALMGAALVALGLAGAWLTRDSWSMGMLVMPPHTTPVREAPPADVRAAIEVTRTGATVRSWVFDPQGTPRGTVLMLHGIRSGKLHLVSGAHHHAAHGLRAVVVDSRGHGESSGRYLTYGVEESRDLVALVDELARHDLLVAPLSVVGSSYGAATALQYAALDTRVSSVVALAPFASLREVVPAYLHWIFGSPAAFIPSLLVNDLIDGATRRAGFDADAACPRCVAPSIRAKVLLVHSRDDERIPYRHSLEIRAALRTRRELMLVDHVGHLGVGRAPGVGEAIDRWLGGS